MIHPNAAKDRETAEYPYVDLFRDFAAAVCRPNSTLVCYGYSFGDEHVNRVIEDMLTIPSTHLVVISYSDPMERIHKICGRLTRPAQVTQMIGDHLGNLESLVDHYLPKPAIDLATSRMAELIKARIGAEPGNRKITVEKSGENRRVKIGTSPLAADADVMIDPDRLFGRHLAVLGDTGSGKSCSVAGLIRWSLEQASTAENSRPDARFIVLDPNGEYSRAFADKTAGATAAVLKVEPSSGEKQLQVPLWFWNSAEWSSFTQASAKTQRPLLKRALREVKAGRPMTETTSKEARELKLRKYVSSRLTGIRNDFRSGTSATTFGHALRAIRLDLAAKRDAFPTIGIDDVLGAIDSALDATVCAFTNRNGERVETYYAFTEQQVERIETSMTGVLGHLGGIIYDHGPGEDTPLRFAGADLADHLDILAEQENVSQFVDFLVARIRTFLADTRMKGIVENPSPITLLEWLQTYNGKSINEDPTITIVDLSLVPTEIVHIVTAVIARIEFEALQRYRRQYKKTLPTVIAMEEAHTFIRRYKAGSESYDASNICCQVFERIAREGRKFGLGLVISSQRPSELSPTVLSQCNTFLLHRISNDEDQRIVQHLVPDNLRSLLSVDFSPSLFDAMLSLGPSAVRVSVAKWLRGDPTPSTLTLPHALTFRLKVRLGKAQQNDNGEYIPMIAVAVESNAQPDQQVMQFE